PNRSGVSGGRIGLAELVHLHLVPPAGVVADVSQVKTAVCNGNILPIDVAHRHRDLRQELTPAPNRIEEGWIAAVVVGPEHPRVPLAGSQSGALAKRLMVQSTDLK